MDTPGGRQRFVRDPAIAARRRALLAYLQAKQRIHTPAGATPPPSPADNAARAARRFGRP